jgi:hypothetical protein
MVLVRRGDLEAALLAIKYIKHGYDDVCSRIEKAITSPSQGWIGIPKKPTQEQIQAMVDVASQLGLSDCKFNKRDARALAKAFINAAHKGDL